MSDRGHGVRARSRQLPQRVRRFAPSLMVLSPPVLLVTLGLVAATHASRLGPRCTADLTSKIGCGLASLWQAEGSASRFAPLSSAEVRAALALALGLGLVLGRVVAGRSRFPLRIEPLGAKTESAPAAELFRGLLHQRLSVSGMQLGVSVSGSQADLASESDVMSPIPVSGYLVRAVQNLVLRSLRVHGTVVTGSFSHVEAECGVALHANRSGGASHVVSVRRAATIDDLADLVAADIGALVARLDRRRAERWTPDGTTNWRVDRIRECFVERRFDQGLVLCAEALGENPGAERLHLMMGNLFERVSDFTSAIASYQAGLASLTHRGLMWQASSPGPARLGRSDRKEPEVHDLMWRHSIVLTFADRWVNHWLRGLSYPRPGEPRAGATPDRYRATHEANRSAEARRMRGFFELRYLGHDRPLRSDFPLLAELVFSPRDRQGTPLNRADVRPRPEGARTRGLHVQWKADCDLVTDLAELWAWLAIDAEDSVFDAINRTGTRKLNRADAKRYAAFLSGAGAADVRRLDLALDSHKAVSILLREESTAGVVGLDRLRRLSLALDLRTLFVRAAMWELRETRRIPRRKLSRLHLHLAELACAARLAERLEPAFDQTVERRDVVVQWGSRSFASRDELARHINRRLRRLMFRPVRYWYRLTVTDGQERAWLDHYFAACVDALLIKPPPEPPGPGVDRQDWYGNLEQWMRKESERAEAAVVRLNRVLLAQLTSDAGFGDRPAAAWILFEDPDLQRLRLHPQFSKWAEAQAAAPAIDSRRLAEFTTPKQRPTGWKFAEIAYRGYRRDVIHAAALGMAKRWNEPDVDKLPFDMWKALIDDDEEARGLIAEIYEVHSAKDRVRLLELSGSEPVPFPNPVESAIKFTRGEEKLQLMLNGGPSAKLRKSLAGEPPPPSSRPTLRSLLFGDKERSTVRDAARTYWENIVEACDEPFALQEEPEGDARHPALPEAQRAR